MYLRYGTLAVAGPHPTQERSCYVAASCIPLALSVLLPAHTKLGVCVVRLCCFDSILGLVPPLCRFVAKSVVGS
jgi:hypothetical protein